MVWWSFRHTTHQAPPWAYWTAPHRSTLVTYCSTLYQPTRLLASHWMRYVYPSSSYIYIIQLWPSPCRPRGNNWSPTSQYHPSWSTFGLFIYITMNLDLDAGSVTVYEINKVDWFMISSTRTYSIERPLTSKIDYCMSCHMIYIYVQPITLNFRLARQLPFNGMTL